LLLEERAAAILAVADRIVGRLDQEPVGVRVEGDDLADVLQHELLRLGPRRAEVVAPAADAERLYRLAVPVDGFKLRVLEWVLVRAVVAEGCKAQEHLD